MIARSILLSLLAASVAGFDYFVSRGDGRGVCVSNEAVQEEKDLLPLYDLENGALPEEREELWTDSWQFRKLRTSSAPTNEIKHNYKIVTTDGSEQFKRVAQVPPTDSAHFFLLASNATLIWSEQEDWRQDRAWRVHLNQRAHPKKQRWLTWVEECTDLSTKFEKCSRLKIAIELNGTGGADILSAGRSWNYLNMWSGGQTFSLNTKEAYMEWNSRTFREFYPSFLFARTEATPGVILVPLTTSVVSDKEQSGNSMTRTFRVGPDGKLCLEVSWDWYLFQPFQVLGRFKLFNSNGGLERRGQLVDGKRLNFKLGRGGDFKLRLYEISENIVQVGACAADNFKVGRPSSGCVVYEKDFKSAPTATLLSAPHNASLQVDLTQEQMRKVCTALGVKAEENALRFSSKRGAAFKKCP